MKKKLLISFSGGRSSAFMTWWLLTYKKDEYEMIVVFANTGKEREETLQFIQQCDKEWGFKVIWIEAVHNPENSIGVFAKIVDFETADRTGQVFESCIAKHGLPNQETPHCSRQMKEECVKALARQIGWRGRGKKYETAIGIRADEPRRLNFVKAKEKHLVYPLATMVHTTKTDINLFWSKQTFDLNLKSYEGNCDLCWKKSNRKLMTIVSENPQIANWWRQMEQKYENFLPPFRSEANVELPLRMFRGNETVDGIIEESKLPFDKATDESKILDTQVSLWDQHLDGNYGCVESCEAF